MLTKGPLHHRRQQVVPRFSPLAHPHGHRSESFFVSCWPCVVVMMRIKKSVSFPPVTKPASGAKASPSLHGAYGWTATESLSLSPPHLPLLPGTSITGDSEATVTGPSGWVGDQMPSIQKVGFYVFSGSKRGQEPTLHGSLLLKTHSHRLSDQRVPQEKGRLDEAGLLKLLGLEGSLTLTHIKQKG